MTYHERFMRLALQEATEAASLGEVPVGAIIVYEERIIGRGYNQTETLHDPTAHAEMIAITAAAAELGQWRLEGCRMYVTLEPCPMCAGAIVNARLSALMFGAYDSKAGATGSLYTITTDGRLNHKVETLGGILDNECGAILSEFFLQRRLDQAVAKGGGRGWESGPDIQGGL
jgi:tRNA(adenine34) deaminase